MSWMRQNVGRAVMGRLVASSLAAFLSLALPAMAGDRALIDYVGFSEDFRYFAFEEFGIQDGSGFAYSTFYVVDLETDSWVVGTPIRLQAESELTSLAAIREGVAVQAADHIDEFKISVPGEIAAMIGDGVPDTDAKGLEFGAPGYMPGDVSGRYTLSLSTFNTTAISPCDEWFGTTPLGYELTIADSGTERLIHRDQNLPRSRGCPMDYRIHSVVMPFEGATLSNAVAILSVYPGGFEGPDRRFLAVPLGL
jgi:predicted secreted protein